MPTIADVRDYFRWGKEPTETQYQELIDLIEAGGGGGFSFAQLVAALQEGSNISFDVDLINEIITINFALGADENFVTDAEKIVIGNTSGTNTGDQDLSGYAQLGTPLVPATKTKISYDIQGLVTAGADAAISDITGLQTALDAKLDATSPHKIYLFNNIGRVL